MQTLKKKINRYIQAITLTFLAATLIITVAIEISNEKRHALENASKSFYQIEQILEENSGNLEQVKDTYSQTCLNRAEAIAYIIQQQPSVLESVDALKEIAEFIEVDEIHIFDSTGRIFTGTHPEYFDYTFDSGEQISFFKPMLEDKSLRLCQEIAPNTAQGKLMQYSALWSENGEFIIQIGMEPVNVMSATEKNELSYIFSLLKVNVGVDYYAIDIESGIIVGSTASEVLDRKLTQVGFEPSMLLNQKDGFSAVINGVRSFCVFKRIGTNYIGRVISEQVLYQRLPSSVVKITVSLILIAVTMITAVTWYMNRYVVGGIKKINQKLRRITRGDLNESVDIRSSLEFSELSSHINDMVKALLDNNKKMSYVLSKTNMYIGIYEYNEFVKNVQFTEYIPKILMLDEEETARLSSSYSLFNQHLHKIQKNTVAGENDVFCIGENNDRFVMIEEINENNDIFGVIVDVTDEINKRRKLEAERDIDQLTGIYNRRGLDSMLTTLFATPEQLCHSALVMIDADGLKNVNDIHGHEAGDIYLKKIAGIINNFGLKNSVAARLGGDEFVLFLYEYDDDSEIINSLNALEYIQNHSTVRLNNELSVPLRFSFGYCITGDQTDYRILMKEADVKMYENKRSRKLSQEQ